MFNKKRRGLLRGAQIGQDATNAHKLETKCQEIFLKAGFKCVCLDATSRVNKENKLNIMVEDINPHITGITERWANKDISDAELGLT